MVKNVLNDNNNFEGFDTNFGDDGFGNSDSGFGGFSSDTSGFDDFGDFSDFGESSSDAMTPDSSSSNQDTDLLDFSDSSVLNNTNTNESNKGLKKTAIVTICIGVVVIVAVILIASALGKKDDKLDEVVNNSTNSNNYHTQQDNNTNEIMQSSNNNEYSTQVSTNNTNKEWTEITDKENIEFNKTYSNLVFTVTNIKHYAKLTDNTLVVKTELTGSISGMSGTYKLDVPYNKGVKLNIGNEFNVSVLIGSFNGKNVVGDIKY